MTPPPIFIPVSIPDVQATPQTFGAPPQNTEVFPGPGPVPKPQTVSGFPVDIRPNRPGQGDTKGDEIISVGDRSVKTWQSALISMIGEVLEDEEISIQLIDTNGRQKNALLDVTGRTKELTSPDLLFPGLGFSPQSPNLKPISR